MSLRVGLLVVLCQASTAALIWPLDRPMARFLSAWAPETAAEALSRPRFIYPAAAEDTATALDLAARERGRLADRLPMLLDAVRDGGLTSGHPGRAALDAGSTALEVALDDFLAEALSRAGSGTDRALLDGLVAGRARSADLAALREAVGSFAGIAETTDPNQQTGDLLRRMAEALHLLLSEHAEALAVASAEAAATLGDLTADRSEMLEALRRRIARSESALRTAEHESLLRAMALFERAVWLLRRQAVALREG
jgi:phosphate:Na+ symporter